ncbi:MAG: hypothetical protein O7J95_21585, partial [Planctomycetota bacterium]|nr:hypothetical protein [Planctomycetota bacterium]
MRGLVLYSEDERLRRDAFAILKLRYEATGNVRARLDLIAARALGVDDPLLVGELAEALLENGRNRAALTVALTLPEWAQPLEVVLRTAYHLQWWSVFDEALRRMNDERERHYWRGLRHASSGDHEDALVQLDAAGPRGVRMASSLRQSLDIRDELESESLLERSRAVLRWEAWQRDRPGPRYWRYAPERIVDYAFTAFVLNRETGGRSLQYGASKERPVILEVMGPTALRLNIRALRDRGDVGVRDEWVEVRRDGILIPVPLTTSSSLEELSIWRNDHVKPGLHVSTDVELGPGLHRISIHSSPFTTLVRVLEQDVEHAIGVLPRISPATLASVLSPSLSPAQSRASFYPGRVWFLPQDGTRHEVSAPIRFLDRDLGEPLRSLPRELGGVLAARLVLRLGARELVDQYHDGLRQLAAGELEVHADEQNLARRYLGVSEDGTTTRADLVASEAALLGSGHLKRVLDLPPPRSRSDVRRRMRAFLYVAEMYSFLRDAAIVKGEELFHAHPDTPGLQRDWKRLTRDRKWRRVKAIRDSAGVRHVRLSGWRPELPALRVRKALIPPLADGERLVTGQNRLVYSLSRSRSTVLRVEVVTLSVGFVAPVAQDLYYELNDWGRRTVNLPPDGFVKSFEVGIPPGDHTLRIGSEIPLPNQFLRVRFGDIATGTNESFRPETGESSRLYHVATREKPLWLAVKGPAWLRIDQLRGERSTVSYRAVDAGWQDVRLEPEEGEESALYRVFQHEHSDPPALVSPASANVPEGPVARPASLHILNAELPRFLQVSDLFPLGGQEDGTLTLAGVFRRRRAFEEDGDERIIAEQFFDLQGVHRYFDPRRDTYFETGLLSRVREEGGPVVGAWEDVHYAPSWLPFEFRATSRAFMQWPNGGAAEPAGPSEWSLHGRASVRHQIPLSLKARMIPGVSFFGRKLSLDDRNDYRPGRVDN